MSLFNNHIFTKHTFLRLARRNKSIPSASEIISVIMNLDIYIFFFLFATEF